MARNERRPRLAQQLEGMCWRCFCPNGLAGAVVGCLSSSSSVVTGCLLSLSIAQRLTHSRCVLRCVCYSSQPAEVSARLC